MEKAIAKFSDDEFKNTFPIILKGYNDNYKGWYESERQSILIAVNAEDVVRINHIGSNAVEGLVAKPTIDILLEIDGRCNVTKLTNDLKATEYGQLKTNILRDIEKGVIERMPNGYSVAKFAFVDKYSKLAKQRYTNKYKPS